MKYKLLQFSKVGIIFTALLFLHCSLIPPVLTITSMPTAYSQIALTNTPISLSTPTPSITQTITPTRSFTLLPTHLPASMGGGGKIVYTLAQGCGSLFGIYLYDIKLGKEIPIANGIPIIGEYYSWSPDGKQIVFESSTPEDNLQLLIVDVASGKVHSLAYSKTSRYVSPSWSPDGKHIAFASDRDTSGKEFRIYIMDTNGNNITRITNFDSNAPSWSHDGKLIAFSITIFQGEKAGIYKMNYDGTNIVRLTNFGDIPQWSPDNKKIAFENENVDLNGNGIFIMNADGSGINRIGGGVDPSWSPDGKQLAFFYPTNYCESNIGIMDIDGKNQILLPTSLGAIYPMWSN